MPDMSLIDNISEALGNSDGQTPDEIREELRVDGVDIDTLEQRLLKYKDGLMGEYESNMKYAKSVGADISKPIEDKRCIWWRECKLVNTSICKNKKCVDYTPGP